MKLQSEQKRKNKNKTEVYVCYSTFHFLLLKSKEGSIDYQNIMENNNPQDP
jgi:hypothetical protein